MRLVILSVLLSANLAACDEAKEGDKAVASAPQEKPRLASGEFDTGRRGERAPALSLERQDGSTTTLAAFRGRPLLVNLWATWCAPCIAEMPALDRLALAQRGKLHVVGVSQDMQGWVKVRPFVAKAGLEHMSILLDEAGALSTKVGAAGLPVTILYDAEGREVWRVNGPREWGKPGGFRPR